MDKTWLREGVESEGEAERDNGEWTSKTWMRERGGGE